MRNNLNKSINYTSTTTTNHESQDIGSNYGNIVEGAAITGAIAAGTVWAGEWIGSVKAGYVEQFPERTISTGDSSLFDSGSPNAGWTNSKIGVNVSMDVSKTPITDQYGNLIKEGTKYTPNEYWAEPSVNQTVNYWASNQNPIFKTLNLLPGMPSFADFHDAVDLSGNANKISIIPDYQ